MAQYKGAHVAPNITVENLLALQALNPKVIRLPLLGDLFNESLLTWEGLLPHVTVPLVVNFARPLGNPAASTAARNTMLSQWNEFLSAFGASDKIVALGILNEPDGDGSQTKELMRQSHMYLRARSTKKIIITNSHSDPAQFHKCLYVNDQNVWYEAHMYLPMKLTHQGLNGRPTPIDYPTQYINKNTLVNGLSRVRRFQTDHHAHMYIGECGISTFASVASRRAYMKDCIDIFESYNWNWSYHAWREAAVWNLEPNVINTVSSRWI